MKFSLTVRISFHYPGAISQNANNKQVLDKLQVERERGITVKAQVSDKFDVLS